MTLARMFATVDLTKWIVYYPGPLTASGHNEVVGSFVTKREAEEWRAAHPAPDLLKVARW